MDIISEFLVPKECPKGMNEKVWKNYQKSLIESIIQKRGIHRDEIENFNSYLPQILNLYKEHVKSFVIDENNHLHYLYSVDLHYNLPYEKSVGLDNPERALIRGNYECKVYGVIVYEIWKKDESNPIKNKAFCNETKSLSSNNTVKTYQINYLNEINTINNVDSKHEHNSEDNETLSNEDEQDNEEEDDDDEEENVINEEEYNEIEEYEDDEYDLNDEEEDDVNEEEEELDDDDDDDEEEIDVEEEDEEKKSSHKSNSVKKKPANIKEKKEKPSNIKPAFFIEQDDYASYNTLVFRKSKHMFLFNIPVLIKSNNCIMSTPLRVPSLYSKNYFMPCSYMISRNFKICPYNEYYYNNRVIVLKKEECEIRSKFYHPSKRFRTNSTLKFSYSETKLNKGPSWKKPPRFLVEIPHEKPKKRIPIIVLAMAYGWSPSNFETCVRMFLNYNTSPGIEMLLRIVRTDLENCMTQEDAIHKISTKLSKCSSMNDENAIVSYVSFTLRGEFFPNLIDMENENIEYENLRKGYSLAEALASLIQMSDPVNSKRPEHKQWQCDDLRSYVYKRVDTPGEMLTILARKFIKHYAKKATSNLKKCVEASKCIDLTQILNRKMIKLTNSVKNGVWDSKSDASENNQNKTQMMIMGYCGDSAHVQTQKILKFAMEKNSNPEPLMTHPTQLGRIDPYLTPESEKCGIIRFKALGAWFTQFMNGLDVMKCIMKIIKRISNEVGFISLIEKIDVSKEEYKINMFCPKGFTIVQDVFGGVIGWVKDPIKMYKIIRNYRRKCIVYPYLSMYMVRKTDSVPIFVFNCDEGRIMRPLVILENFRELTRVMNGPAYLYHSDPTKILMENGIIEYLDAAEEYCGFVFTADSLNTALQSNLEHTHMEISAIFALSITVCKAFCNFNQGPRRMYTGNMEKRSISLKLFEDRGTTVSYSLWYGQLPMFSDPVDEVMGFRYREPNGTNVLISILSMPENMEDALIMKKEAIERGLCCTSEINVVTCVLGEDQVFKKPDATCFGQNHEDKYRHLKPNGLPEVGTILSSGEAVIGRVFSKRVNGVVRQRCMSKFLAWNETYKVKEIRKYPLKNPKVVQVSLISHNTPSVGDKFFFKNGQKSTCGRIVSSIDLPFISGGPMAGVSPDIVINVCSLSRVTQGLLLEVLLSQGRAINPSLLAQYDTVFLSESSLNDKLKICSHILRSSGLNPNGKYQMNLGTTGEPIQSEIYSGLIYMGVLKHMAKDKLRSRDRGPVNELTRQASVGKKNDGGLKMGEMENGNLFSYAMSAVFKDINYESADKFTLYWCSKCNTQCIGCFETAFYFCKLCNSSDHVVRIPNTYITNLCFQEMEAAGFGHTLVVEKVQSDDVNIGMDDELIFDQNRFNK
jgi:DNA-directed RNA polymerase subunit B'